MKKWLLFYLSLFKVKANKKKPKIVLVFNDLTDLDKLIKDFTNFQNIAHEPQHLKDKIILSNNILEDIPLNPNTLCILFSNLELLEKSDKLEDVSIEKIAIRKNKKDRWNKLVFKNNLIDSTGYFHGEFSDEYILEKSMFFNVKDLNEEIKQKNVENLKKLIFYISVLKKVNLRDLLKEICQLDFIDLIIFKNMYKFKENENIKVCVCRDIECTICDGIYDTNKFNL